MPCSTPRWKGLAFSGGAVLIAMTLAGCGGAQPADGGTKAAAAHSLDSMAVIGHSNATGTMSDPSNVGRDAHENSWATGENPEVDSVYLRLLRDHPALKGHNYNAAVNGTRVDDLEPQFEVLLGEAHPPPDLILIQTVDNDMRCDGTDPDNYRPFGIALDRALTHMQKAIPGVQFFIVSQWASAKTWAAWAAHHTEQVSAYSVPGPCQLFNPDGTTRPTGVRSMQRIVDSYWAQILKACAAHPGCFTDRGAEQAFVPTDRDLAADLNHLSIAGHRKHAAIAWGALPQEIKQRP
ncbi:MAG: family lipase [Marmoricola sp.]|nr:family lipase [Marmoricola sp.]